VHERLGYRHRSGAAHGAEGLVANVLSVKTVVDHLRWDGDITPT